MAAKRLLQRAANAAGHAILRRETLQRLLSESALLEKTLSESAALQAGLQQAELEAQALRSSLQAGELERSDLAARLERSELAVTDALSALAESRRVQEGALENAVAILSAELGERPDELGGALKRLVEVYAGYKRAYEVVGEELGTLKTTAAPVIRSDAEMAPLAGKPGIFLVTLPKSATVFIANSLALSLGYTLRSTLVTPTFPKNLVWRPMLWDFQRGGMVSASHMDADEDNLSIMSALRVRRVVLHIRDIRAALYSWIRFLEDYDAVQFRAPGIILTPRTATEEIDRTIAGASPWIRWIERWLDVIDSNRLEVLLVKHEELLIDNTSYFDRILSFYGIDAKISPVKKSRETHFRTGDNIDWRAAFTGEQVRRVNAMIPERIWTRLGWEP